MATEKLSVILELVSGNYKREAREAATATAAIGAGAQRSTTAMGGLTLGIGRLGGVLAGVFAGREVLDFAQDTIESASKLEEAVNAVNVVFTEAAGTIRRFGESSATAVGLAESEFLQMSTVLGAALQNAGLSADEAAESTIRLTERAADMASVFNTDVADALGAIQAALRGEIDPIERFGVSLTAAAVEARALALGFERVDGQFDAAAKSAARLSLIMEQTDAVAGDFANTSDSVANAQKILAAQFEDTKARLGEALLPVMQQLLALLTELGPTLEQSAKGFVDIVAAAKPLIDVLTELVKIYNQVKGAIDGAANSSNALLASLGKIAQAPFQGGLVTFIRGVQDLFGGSPVRGSGVRPRASGGSVWAGQPYLVGEAGQELFIPGTSGSIVSNRQLLAALGRPNMTGGSITLVNPVTRDLPQDLQYGALLANHATFGKF